MKQQNERIISGVRMRLIVSVTLALGSARE
jgi:hypothetical protein